MCSLHRGFPKITIDLGLSKTRTLTYAPRTLTWAYTESGGLLGGKRRSSVRFGNAWSSLLRKIEMKCCLSFVMRSMFLIIRSSYTVKNDA